VSHDREFLDGLATKVYEFGGGRVREHLGGIYDFLQKKNLESLAQLGGGATPATNGDARQKASEPSDARLSYEEQKELGKRKKKAERMLADTETQIAETESAIAILESRMATPEDASDTTLYERHGRLKQQLARAMDEWETLSAELETLNG
jgi:ATP-binding cassette subfamily F protein 3